jgi:hypothetical protein
MLPVQGPLRAHQGPSAGFQIDHEQTADKHGPGPSGDQPSTIAAMINYGSAPVATASGRGASCGSCDRSSWQAKKRRKGGVAW